MSDGTASKKSYPRYPLVENRVQVEIMAYVRAEAGPVSRARLTEALSSSRGKITAEVARLIEAGLLAEGAPPNPRAGAVPLCLASRTPRA